MSKCTGVTARKGMLAGEEGFMDLLASERWIENKRHVVRCDSRGVPKRGCCLGQPDANANLLIFRTIRHLNMTSTRIRVVHASSCDTDRQQTPETSTCQWKATMPPFLKESSRNTALLKYCTPHQPLSPWGSGMAAKVSSEPPSGCCRLLRPIYTLLYVGSRESPT